MASRVRVLLMSQRFAVAVPQSPGVAVAMWISQPASASRISVPAQRISASSGWARNVRTVRCSSRFMSVQAIWLRCFIRLPHGNVEARAWTVEVLIYSRRIAAATVPPVFSRARNRDHAASRPNAHPTEKRPLPASVLSTCAQADIRTARRSETPKHVYCREFHTDRVVVDREGNELTIVVTGSHYPG